MTITDVPNFQQLATSQGADYETLVRHYLEFRRWTISPPDVEGAKGNSRWIRHGSSIDIVARDPAGVEHWIECKGANGGSKRKPGLEDGTTVKVAIGVGYYLRSLGHDEPYIVCTSHLPNPGSLPARMLAQAIADGAITDVWQV